MAIAKRLSRLRQRGMVSLIVVALLITGVLYILGQTLGIIGTRAIDNNQALDSTAAVMLAESGLQRAQAVLTAAANASSLTNTTCTGLTTGNPFSLGRGTFSYGTPVSTPSTCASSSCTSCTIPVTGTVGSTSRTLSLTMNFRQVNGVTGRGTSVTMVLKNTHTVGAMALFNLAWQRQASGGNADASICTNGATGCSNVWNVESSNGNSSVGGMGVTVDIAASTLSKPVTQTLSRNRNFVEVGALFPGSSVLPTVIGSYWMDDSSTGNNTVAKSNGTVGQTNSGVATSSGTCTASPNTYGSGSHQSCTNWCYGGDTLIFGVAGRSASYTNELSAVTFNTNGTPAQNIAMSRVVHFPATDGTIANATGTIFSEVWKAYNPAYMLPVPGSGLGATTYAYEVKGTIGGSFQASSIANNTTTMVITGFNNPDSRLCIGDTLTATSPNKFAANTKVTTTPDNPTGLVTGAQCSASTGTYKFDTLTTGSMNTPSPVITTSNKLVAKYTIGTVTLNSPVQSSGSNIATPTSSLTTDTNVYGLSSYISQRALQVYTQGTGLSTTISMPAGSTAPANGTIVAVYSGTGVFQAQTSVVSSTGTTFTVDKAPTTGLADAAICGGTCAFFASPSSTSATTQFSVTRSGSVSQWSGGFTCLSGVNNNLIVPVTSGTSSASTWQESVQ